MSGIQAESTHFLDWLRARNWTDASSQIFVPRRIYGEYLGQPVV
jgi:uncharacterized NAD(P)/FAD-binding protein YdhS